MGASSTSAAVLTIAGFDPSSGAGITADLAVFAAHECFGISAVTALTVQSTLGVQRVQPVDAHLLADTLACLEADLPPAGIKIGMLADEPQVEVVINYLTKLRNEGRQPHVVLDPVLISSSGRELLSSAGRTRLLQDLLPLVQVVTPNADELKQLTGMASSTEHDIEAAAIYLNRLHPGMSVLVTGGDREHPDDTLLQSGALTILRGTRVVTSATHGTGCALSSALLCGLVHGKPPAQAARAAKNYVEGAMRRAQPRGGGKGPMALLWPLSGHREL